jgi:glutaredoxin
MPIICPKCRTVRPDNASVPDWQCPACGVAYAKAGGDASASPAVQRAREADRRQAGRDAGDQASSLLGSIPWGKLVAAFFICYGGWIGYQHSAGERGGDAVSAQVSRAGKMGGSFTEQGIREIAARGQASDVIFYTAPWCPHCRAAHGWMDQYGFKYERCDIEASSDCKAQLQRLDPQGGVPYLIVKGQHMKDGFDAEQLVAVLGK